MVNLTDLTHSIKHHSSADETIPGSTSAIWGCVAVKQDKFAPRDYTKMVIIFQDGLEIINDVSKMFRL